MLDSLGYDAETGDPLYKHWPYLITQDAASGIYWSVLYDNIADGTFDLGCEHDNYYGFFRSYESAKGGDLDMYITLGPDLRSLIPKFLRLTGPAAMPPRWTLGYAQTAMALFDSKNAQEQLETLIKRIRDEKFPISSFHFGSGYTSIGAKRYVFHWNSAKFPTPKSLMEAFHAANIRVVANVKPCLLDDHPKYAHVLDSQGFVSDSGRPVISQFWDGEGAHIDFSHAAGIQWWKNGVKSLLEAGIDSMWNDNNEYGFFDEGDSAHVSGFGEHAIKLDLARPLQCLWMTRSSLDAQVEAKPQERPYVISRAGVPGMQRYAQTWSGDNTTSWRHLKWSVRIGLQMSLSGMGSIGHDVGGFAGPVPEAELLIRWTQLGSIHPRFIMNSWKPDGVYNSPWLHPEATSTIRKAIGFRYRLIPYLYSLMRSAVDGLPPLRPTFLEFPGDKAAHHDSDALMVGPFLLAAPVVAAGVEIQQLYLPRSDKVTRWIDLWTQQIYNAGETVSLPSPLSHLPACLAEGSLLPITASESLEKLHDEPSRMVLAFPGLSSGSSCFHLAEDDGISANGPVSLVVIHMDWTVDAVRIRVTPPVGAYKLPYSSVSFALPASEKRTIKFENVAELAVEVSTTAWECALASLA